jgi:hypothetical protein
MPDAEKFDEAAFEAWWESLLERHETLRMYRDGDRLRGLTFADFRNALRDAFIAGRQSIL